MSQKVLHNIFKFFSERFLQKTLKNDDEIHKEEEGAQQISSSKSSYFMEGKMPSKWVKIHFGEGKYDE